MRKFCKRTPALALAALLAAPALGCPLGTGSQITATPDTTTQIGISNEESRTEESKDMGELVTVRLVHCTGEQAKKDALDAMLVVSSEAYLEIKVNVEVVASSSRIATYRNYIAAEEAPDITFGKPQTMQELMDGGYFMDLKDEACMVNVLPMLANECTVNGGIYGFPIDARVKTTFYNKEMFQKVGMEAPVAKGELFKVYGTFMDQGAYPFVHPYNFIHGVFHEPDSFFTSMAAVTGNENAWMSPQNGVKDLLGNPVVVEVMEMFSKFASYKDTGDAAADQTRGVQNFVVGQRPTYMNGGWLMGDVIAASLDGKLGMFPTPQSDNSEEDKLWIGIDDVFIAPRQTGHRDEVMTLLNSFANEEGSETWVSTAKLMTSSITVPTDDADAFTKEIKSHTDNNVIVSKSLVSDYTSEYPTVFRTKLQELATLDDNQRDVTKLLKDIDNETASIRQ